MSPQAGWYPDPTDPEHYIRYWDGTKWTGNPKRIAPPNAPGEKLQAVGNSIAKTPFEKEHQALGLAALPPSR